MITDMAANWGCRAWGKRVYVLEKKFVVYSPNSH
jgi:hypothetical protein